MEESKRSERETVSTVHRIRRCDEQVGGPAEKEEEDEEEGEDDDERGENERGFRQFAEVEDVSDVERRGGGGSGER